MAFLGPWAVDGATTEAVLARLMLRASTSGSQGVVEAGDMVVSATGTPSGNVTVGSGACVILGQEGDFQGSYFDYNAGAISVPITATGGSGGRSDLIVARVEDPTTAGTPWTNDPATDPLTYIRVIEGVDPTTTRAPDGTSAIPLARIDIPVSTTNITSAMIHDLRGADENVVQGLGRSYTTKQIEQGVDPIDLAGNIIYPTYENWPDLVFTQVVPDWATQVQVVAGWTNALFTADDGNGDAQGHLRVRFYLGSDEVVTADARYNFNINASNAQRVSAFCADQIAIPAALRGKKVNVAMQCAGASSSTHGRLRADAWSNFWVDMTFQEIPVPDIDA